MRQVKTKTGSIRVGAAPRPVARGILEAIGNTPLVELPTMSPKPSVKIYAKLEGANPSGSVKDRIAVYMIEKGEAEGKLTKDKTILEPTSGNTGISLAMVGRLKGYRVKVVMPENVSPERAQILRAYGAEVVLSPAEGGSNKAAMTAQEMAAGDDRYFMPYQYGNEANPLAHYETTGEEIVRDLPDVDVFVAGLGTGGTLMGVGRRLKGHNPNVKVVAVAPHPDDVIQGLRSLEEGFIPPIMDLSVLDTRIMIDSDEAFAYTKALLHKEGIFAGISSGSAVACARRVAARMDGGKVVCLLADGGWKYLSTGLWTRDWNELQKDIEGKVWW
ncbi:MAG: cysteine synthase family protein [SAR202 cluster bacterium]|nr:cysteine synthase family protein [SAR202 cluster bacterium]